MTTEHMAEQLHMAAATTSGAVSNEFLDQSRAAHLSCEASAKQDASEKWTVERLVTALGFGLDGQHMKDMRKTYQKVVNEINESRAAHLSREAASAKQDASEPPFDATKHHPSCTPNDQDLMWVCAQCGHKVPEEKQT